MPKESTIQRQCMEYLRQRGAKVYNIVGHPYQQKAIPDLLACYKGHFLALEIKTESGIATKLQVRELEAIDEAGGISAIIRSKDELAQILDGLPGMSRKMRHKAPKSKSRAITPSKGGATPKTSKNGSAATTEPKKAIKNVTPGQSNHQRARPATRGNSRNKKAVPMDVSFGQGRLPM